MKRCRLKEKESLRLNVMISDLLLRWQFALIICCFDIGKLSFCQFIYTICCIIEDALLLWKLQVHWFMTLSLFMSLKSLFIIFLLSWLVDHILFKEFLELGLLVWYLNYQGNGILIQMLCLISCLDIYLIWVFNRTANTIPSCFSFVMLSLYCTC